MEKRTKIILYILAIAGLIAVGASFYGNVVVENIQVFLIEESAPVPISEVSNEMQACEWSPVYFFFFSENVFDKFIYYSHFAPAILSLMFGLYVFLKSKHDPLARTLMIIVFLFFVWSMADMILWATNQPKYTMFFWSITNLIEPLIYFACLYFTHLFLSKKPLPLKSLLLVGTLLLPTFILLPTHFDLEGFDLSNCDRDAMEGTLVFFNYFIEAIFMGWALILILKKYFASKEQNQKSEALTILFGLALFLISFTLGNVVGSYTGDWKYGQYGLLGMPFFIGFLAYSIVKYKTFNIKLVGSFALVFTLAVLNFSLIFIRDVTTFRAVTVITFLLTIIFGIALIKSILREIRQNQAIEKLVKARSEFLTVASHQLRTPVSLITGTLSLMQDGTLEQLPPDQKAKLLDGIFVKSRKLTNIINDILQASEMDIMNFHLSKETIQPLDLQALLKKIHTDLEEKAAASKITLTYEQAANDKTVMVSGNEHYLEEALTNIVDNAIKYTPKGFVKMELISLELGTDKVIVKISDSGIGIPLEDQPKMFEKFKRAKNAVNSYADGSGLGLFIVKKIIEAHPGGKIYFTSPGENKGTAFYIELTTTS